MKFLLLFFILLAILLVGMALFAKVASRQVKGRKLTRPEMQELKSLRTFRDETEQVVTNALPHDITAEQIRFHLADSYRNQRLEP